MAPADSQVDALAGAILDGTRVDWDAAESNADADRRWLLDLLEPLWVCFIFPRQDLDSL